MDERLHHQHPKVVHILRDIHREFHFSHESAAEDGGERMRKEHEKDFDWATSYIHVQPQSLTRSLQSQSTEEPEGHQLTVPTSAIPVVVTLIKGTPGLLDSQSSSFLPPRKNERERHEVKWKIGKWPRMRHRPVAPSLTQSLSSWWSLNVLIFTSFHLAFNPSKALCFHYEINLHTAPVRWLHWRKTKALKMNRIGESVVCERYYY